MSQVSVTINHIDSLGAGRFKIKIAENHINLSMINHNGRSFQVVKSMGRGRFIVREVSIPLVKKIAKFIG